MFMAASARDLQFQKTLVSNQPLLLSSAMTTDVSEAQIEKTGSNPSPHIKEVWFPGTHSDM